MNISENLSKNQKGITGTWNKTVRMIVNGTECTIENLLYWILKQLKRIQASHSEIQSENVITKMNPGAEDLNDVVAKEGRPHKRSKEMFEAFQPTSIVVWVRH